MIGKVSSGVSFSGLAKYLTQSEERVAWTEPRWMIGTDPQEVAREMETAASMGDARLEKPVYHVSISFGEADHPTREQMREAADRVLGELGLSEHQAFLVAHQDKDHPHLHVMVNRAHPDTGKAADVSFDYRRVEGVLRELEKEWGMQRVPGHHARDAGDPAPDRTQSVATGEARRTERTGESSFPQQIRETMGDDLNRAIEQSRSWDELRAALGRHGYRIEPTERGMKITDGERYAKASGVDERLGRFRLEARFGERLTADSERNEARDRSERPMPRTNPDHESVPKDGRGVTVSKDTREGGSGTGERSLEPNGSEPSGRHSTYDALFGTPALEHATTSDRSVGSGSPGSDLSGNGASGAGQLLGVAAVAARPVSSEDGEKEVPFRATEVGLRGAAVLAGRTSQPSPTHDQPSPPTPTLPAAEKEVRAIVRDVQVYERAAGLEQRLSRATGQYAEAERALNAGGRRGQEVARLSETFDRALQEAYHDPAATRQAFEALGERRGPEAAARAMRQSPERFGAVRAAEQKKWLGLATEVSKAEGYAAARGAANVGEQYLHTRRTASDASRRAALEGTLRDRGAEMKTIRQELGRLTRTHGSPDDLLRSIGQQAQKLTTAQTNGLRRALTPRQFSVVAKAAGIAAEAVKGRTR
jgi:hypothetical protein